MKICICPPTTPHLLPAVRAAAPLAEIVNGAEHACDAEIVIGNPPLTVLLENPNLRLLQLRSAGTAKYPSLLREKPDLKLCCATGAYGHAVAEHMFSALLCLMKRLDGYARNQEKRVWRDLGKANSIRGARVLVLGMGDIGCSFARMARAMGAHVVGVRRNASPEPDIADVVYDLRALDDLLPEMDVVAMALPETPETRGVMNEARIQKLKQGAYLLNVGRGSAVNAPALIEALKQGRLAGAFLDVTETEPLPFDDPLWNAPNLLITPHVAGGDHLDDIGKEIARIAAHNVRALLEGGDYMSLVDPDTGYRIR